MNLYRTGAHNPQTIYAQLDETPSKQDRCIGFGASPEDAAKIVDLLNSPLVMDRRMRTGVPVAREWLESRVELDRMRALLAEVTAALDLAWFVAEPHMADETNRRRCEAALKRAREVLG